MPEAVVQTTSGGSIHLANEFDLSIQTNNLRIKGPLSWVIACEYTNIDFFLWVYVDIMIGVFHQHSFKYPDSHRGLALVTTEQRIHRG